MNATQRLNKTQRTENYPLGGRVEVIGELHKNSVSGVVDVEVREEGAEEQSEDQTLKPLLPNKGATSTWNVMSPG